MRFKPGSRLLARITRLEAERGIFIPGHRLEPYRGAELAPWEIRLAGEDGRAFGSRAAPIALKDAGIYTTFFGTDATLAMLIEQSPKNAKAIQSGLSGDAIVQLRAFDLASLYEGAALAAGDYLELELADRKGGSFVARPVAAAGLAPERRAHWLAALAEGAAAAMRELGRPVSPIVFIGEAFAAAPASLRERPAAAFSDYFNEGGSLQIREFGGRPFMWAADADIPSLLAGPAPAGADAEGGGIEGYSQAMADLGFALNADLVEALVRDALWKGGSVDAALWRCFDGAAELGIPEDQIADMLEEARGFARELASEEDPLAGKPELLGMRSSLLELYAPFLAWMRKLGALEPSPSDLDTEDFSLLANSMRSIGELIHLLAAGAPVSARDRENLGANLPAMAAMARELMEAVEAGIRSASRGRRAPRE